MTDQQYVESTSTYLAEHVPWLWHRFASWMLREVCQDQPPECLAIADLHDRWETVTDDKWSSAAWSAAWSAWSSASSAAAAGSSAAAARSAAAGSSAAAARSAAAWSAAAAARSAAAWSRMAAWLRRETCPLGDPLPSADWWDERGQDQLANYLRKLSDAALTASDNTV